MNENSNNAWRIIISGKMSPAENMALDKAILKGVAQGISPNTIRIYDWNPPTVSVGYHQKINEQIDLNKVRDNGFGIVRRPTGGRAVLHFDEVTYAVVAKNTKEFSGSILDVYKKIAKPLLHSLHEININASITSSLPHDSKSQKWHSPCFSSSSKYEINCHGKKIIGSAQVRKNSAFLQHGSILLNNNQEKMADLLPGSNAEKRKIMKKLLARKTVSINQLLDKQIGFEKFSVILKSNFVNDFNINKLLPENLLDEEMETYYAVLEEMKNEIRSYKKS